jgi:hypothetical protein
MPPLHTSRQLFFDTGVVATNMVAKIKQDE